MVNVEKFSRRKSVPLNRLGWWKVWRWEFKDLNVLVLTRLLSQLVLWRISRRFSWGLWGENNFSHRFQAQVISSLLLLLRNSLEFPVVVKFLGVKVKSKKYTIFREWKKKLYRKIWRNSDGSLLKISLDNGTSFWFLACKRKAQKGKNEYDFIRWVFSGIVRPCLNLYKISREAPDAENTVGRKSRSCQTSNIERSRSRTLFFRYYLQKKSLNYFDFLDACWSGGCGKAYAGMLNYLSASFTKWWNTLNFVRLVLKGLNFSSN